jgi:hypothetical protein
VSELVIRSFQAGVSGPWIFLHFRNTTFHTDAGLFCVFAKTRHPFLKTANLKQKACSSSSRQQSIHPKCAAQVAGRHLYPPNGTKHCLVFRHQPNKKPQPPKPHTTTNDTQATKLDNIKHYSCPLRRRKPAGRLIITQSGDEIYRTGLDLMIRKS